MGFDTLWRRKEVGRNLVSGIKKDRKIEIDINNHLIEEYPTEASKKKDELDKRNHC